MVKKVVKGFKDWIVLLGSVSKTHTNLLANPQANMVYYIWRLVTMNTKKIKHIFKVTVYDDSTAEFQFDNIPFPELVRLTLMTLEVGAKKTMAMASDELRPTIESDMHELINVGTSTLLNKLFPEIELRPDITVEAIAKAENELIAEDKEFVAKATDAYIGSADFVKSVAERKQATKVMQSETKKSLGISDRKTSTKKK